MSEITAIPYRTPACDKHLPENDSNECPWCRIKELEAEVNRLKDESPSPRWDWEHKLKEDKP